MGRKQQEKSDTTRAELTRAMEQLFLEKSYEKTSVKDIAEAAGYAVGSFYRHWKSKEQAFLEYCEEYAADFIRQSVAGAPIEGSVEEMLNYLLLRSEEFARSEKTTRLYALSRLLSAAHPDDGPVAKEAENYARMLVQFLRRHTLCQKEEQLQSVASILHTLLDAHALRKTALVYPPFLPDEKTFRDCLLAMISTLQEKTPSMV